MPTYDRLPEFKRDLERLTPELSRVSSALLLLLLIGSNGRSNALSFTIHAIQRIECILEQ